MNLEQLEYIVETAKTGSLTKAAQNCNVTLSAVSQAVSSLEAEFGFSLSPVRGLAPYLRPRVCESCRRPMPFWSNFRS